MTFKYPYLLFLGLLYACFNSGNVPDMPTIKVLPPPNGQIAGTPTATGSPVAGKGTTRPTEQIVVNTDRCGCLQGKAFTLNNCDYFCSQKNDNSPTLYASVTLGEKVLFNSKLGSLWGWCNTDIGDGGKPACKLEVNDGTNTQMIDVTIPNGSNNFKADLTTLDVNTPYVATLVETSSQARSKGFHLRRINPDQFFTHVRGALPPVPVHQYVCVNFTATIDKNVPPNIYSIKAILRHYYYPEYLEPSPVLPNQQNIYCHNPQSSATDNSRLPRLGLVQNMFYLWSPKDIRFADIDPQNNIPDINDIIKKRLETDKGIKNANINLFFSFPWYTHPITNGNEVETLGYIMQPLSDQNVTFCPNRDQLKNSTNAIYKLLYEYVGTDTEAIYLGVSDGQNTTDSQGKTVTTPYDYVLVREGLLRKIWFYIDNGNAVIPDDNSIRNKTIKFYWPPDIKFPHDRKDWQRIYTVRHPSNLSSTQKPQGINLNTSATLPADNRFGCIPILSGADVAEQQIP